MVQWHSRVALWALLILWVGWEAVCPGPAARAASSEPPAVVRGSYRLVAQSQQEKAGDQAASRIWQELETVWNSGPLLMSGLLEVPLASRDELSLHEPARWQGRLDWRLPLGGSQSSSGWQGQWTTGYFWWQRPLSTGDAFRLFHPPSDTPWAHALTAQLHLASPTGETGDPHHRWWAAFQRAWGSSAGKGITWWQVRWEPGDFWRWRFTTIRGEGKRLEDGRLRGPDPYTGWSLDGTRRWAWGQLEWGYAQRSDSAEPGYRAAGFLRLKTRRPGPGSVAPVAEIFRRDEGFRFPFGGDLPWRQGRQGGLVGLQGRWGSWEGQWERLYEQSLVEPQRPAATTDFFRLTWRPGGSWWARIQQEMASEDDGVDQLLYVRWPAPALALQARRTLGDGGERWRFRAEWEPRSRRLRLDWDSRWEAWRAEYRREWDRLRLRMVYKERLDPERPGERQTFSFLQATYSPDERWRVSAAVGWDDRGRTDFHWGRGQRWELVWELLF